MYIFTFLQSDSHQIRRGINEWQGLLQIATSGITNCVSFGDYKLRQKVLQNATALLLQIATKSITNCVRYYKLRQVDYKLRQVLQIATLLQIATVHTRSFVNGVMKRIV